jgi:hypothetical protein
MYLCFGARARARVSVCVCVRERETVCVCVCVCVCKDDASSYFECTRVRTCVYVLTYKRVQCEMTATMTAIIRVSMGACQQLCPHEIVKQLCRSSYAASETSACGITCSSGARCLQSLHLLLTWLWAHMPWPLHWRQWRLSRLCSQMPAPPQSLQV